MVIRHKNWQNTSSFGPSYYLDGWNALYNTTAPYHWDNRRNFRVMYDRMHQLDIQNKVQVGRSFRLKCNIPVTCSTTGAFAVDIVQNAIWIMVFSDSTVTPSPEVFLTVRCKYQDA